MRVLIYLVFSAFLMVNCQNRMPKEKADVLYFGGTILTMEDATPEVEAIALKMAKYFLQELRQKQIVIKAIKQRSLILKVKFYFPVLLMFMDT
ncbi:hypothetical protein [Chryseobacterium carnipullorum]|uniref:hypothetical protein n=1 Tax=Chryseobacterium carnipullorum TaxID=1124835 RepID=UPI001E537660|nr:hypothetical protein [Chryseobacterium carnipullorum]